MGKTVISSSNVYQEIFEAAQNSPGEIELVLKATSVLQKRLGVKKVNWLIDKIGDKDLFAEKTGVLHAIQCPDIGMQAGWQIPDEPGFSMSDALKDELETAGQILFLALQNFALKQQVIVDNLTKLYNRAHFDRCLTHEMERCRRYNTPFSLLMMDVDKFKSFNDTYGHQAGDEVLKIVGKVLKENMRASDLAFRYGGEEFAVILPHADKQKAELIAGRVRTHVDATVRAAERLRESIGQYPLKRGDQTIPITVSVGLSAYAGGETNLTVAEIIGRADAALYRAKQLGRNRSEVIGKEDRLTILIVDDEEEYCQLLVNYFEKREYVVFSTTSGQIALELMNNNRFDLIILDIKLSDISGVDLLKKVQPSKHKNIVALTGIHDEAVKKLCYDYGVCEYLEKPISIEYLDKHLMARILEMKA